MIPQGLKPVSHHEFDKDSSTTFGKIRYCSGRVIYEDRTEVDVTFVYYESLDKAKKVFDTYKPLNDGGVPRVWSFGDAEGSDFEGKGLFVVSFDKFLGFFSEKKFHDIELKLKTGSAFHPGMPTSWVIFLILELIKSLKYLFSMGFTCKLLDLPIAYIWCLDERVDLVDAERKNDERGDPRYKLKVFLVDEVKTNYEEDAWSWVLEDSVSSFGGFLDDYVLVHPDLEKRKLKKSFLEGFDPGMGFKSGGSMIIMPARKRLCMLETSPFLLESVREIVAIVGLANMGIRNGKLEDYNMVGIRAALHDKDLFIKVCPCGHWRTNISEEFKTYLDDRMQEVSNAKNRKNQRKGIKIRLNLTSNDIKDESLITLIRWVRYPFEHASLTEHAILLEAESWSTLFIRVHQVMWYYRIKW